MSSLSQSLAQSLAQSLSNSLIKSNALPFSKGSFTNASPRYITQGSRMTGPFAGGTLATRVIGGKKFAQFESARSTVNTYSEVFRAAISDWGNSNITVSDNAIVSPVGTLTADLITETVDTGAHQVLQTISVDGSSVYYQGVYCKAKERDQLSMRFSSGGFVGTPHAEFNLGTKTIDGNGDVVAYGMIELNDGWFYLYIAGTSDAVGGATCNLYVLNSGGSISYEGDGSSGLYLWGANIGIRNYLTSYIQVAASTVTRAKDQFYFPEANVPAWMRTSFKARLIMHQGTDEMLAADSGEKYIFAFDATASIISLYFDGADKKLKWKNTAGALGESVALDWAIGDVIDIEFTFDNGSNSTLKVDGGGVDTTYNGTSTAATDGNVYWGMDDSEANQLDIALLSELEPL